MSVRPMSQCFLRPSPSMPSPSSITAIVPFLPASGPARIWTLLAPASNEFATSSSTALPGLAYSPSENSSTVLWLSLTSMLPAF